MLATLPRQSTRLPYFGGSSWSGPSTLQGTTLSLTVLVAGATGRFGPIVPLLRERGHYVLAGTRQPDSATARELAAIGAEPVVCYFEDPSSIEAAATGADAVFTDDTASPPP